MELHWLKIKECIVYKVSVLMYKCIKGRAPQFLSEVVIKDHGCSLRPTTLNNLPTVRYNTAIAHHSAFSSTGPRLWNTLPNDIKSSSDLEVFKTRLKPSCLMYHMTGISSFKQQCQSNQLFY